MKNKIHPKNQTDELNRARLEFLKRNPKEFRKLMELFERDLKKRDELATGLASIGDEVNPKLKKSWHFFFAHSEEPFDTDFAEYLSKIESPKAVNAAWRWLDYSMEIEHKRLMLPAVPGKPSTINYEELKSQVMALYCRDARDIFSELTNGRPAVHLLMGIDLTRNKGVILGEVEQLITEYQRKIGVHEIPEKRFKWLSSVDALLEVWDQYVEAGQRPSKDTFRQISRKVNRPLSTVRDQWHEAYRQIFREPYNPEAKYATEEKRGEADQLCSKCPHGAKCYQGADWFPCSDYLRISGKERKPKTIEYMDDIDYSDT